MKLKDIEKRELRILLIRAISQNTLKINENKMLIEINDKSFLDMNEYLEEKIKIYNNILNKISQVNADD